MRGVLAALYVVGMTACGPTQVAPQKPDEPPAAPRAVRTDARQALFSVYLYANGGPQLPKGIEAMPLDQAVARLVDDKSPIAAHQRERAAHALERSKFRKRFKEAIRRLRSPGDQAFGGYRFMQVSGGSLTAPMCRIVSQKQWGPSGSPNGLQTIRLDLVLEPFSSDPDFFTHVRTGLDPQRWAQCSVFFGAPDYDGTFLAAPDGSGHYVISGNPCTGTSAAATPQPYGGVWGPAVLFERFGYTGQPTISITNFLNVQTSMNGSQYVVNYSLEQSECAEMAGDSNYKLMIDSGQATATPVAGGRVEVTSLKNIGWSTGHANAATQLLFKSMASALSDELLDIACCASAW